MIKKHYFFFIFSLFLLLSCASDLKVEQKKLEKKGFKFLYKGKPFTGLGVATSPETKIVAEFEYKDGYRIKKEERREDGTLKAITNFQKGRKISKTIWFKTGVKRSVENYNNGVVVGNRKTWYSNGMLKSEENFSQKGKKHGVQIIYNRNGRKKIKQIYKNGKLVDEIKYKGKKGK